MMAKSAARSKNIPKKRGQGRPVSGENDVGRERLLAATEKLLRMHAARARDHVARREGG